MVTVVCVYIFASYASLYLAQIIKVDPEDPNLKEPLLTVDLEFAETSFRMNFEVKFRYQTLKLMFPPLTLPFLLYTLFVSCPEVLYLLCAFFLLASRLQLCAKSGDARERQRLKETYMFEAGDCQQPGSVLSCRCTQLIQRAVMQGINSICCRQWFPF